MLYKTLELILHENNVDFFLLPSTDEFLSEYSPKYYRRLERVTGFTGSNGMAVIKKHGVGKHVFFTDGRYTIQAKNELGDDFEILNYSTKDVVNWIARNIDKEQVLGIDPKLHRCDFIEEIKKIGCTLKFITNPVDNIWIDRPKAPYSFPFVQPLQYAGKLPADKVIEIIKWIASNNATYHIITDPEIICWLLNIRAMDICNTPVLLCYASVSNEGFVTLFVNNISRVSSDIIQQIGVNVDLVELDQFENYVTSKLSNETIIFDKTNSSYWINIILGKSGAKIINLKSPLLLWKACKNDSEIAGFRQTHVEDAIAVVRSLAEISEILDKKSIITEMDVVKIFYDNRKKSELFICESFDTIAAFGGNGAIIHYHPTENTNTLIEQNGILLIDSGGHYKCGTTDITRTICTGVPTKEHRLHYTLVLMGHISLADYILLDGACGEHVDYVARQYLAENGLDYAHSTGHGVGNCLNVHEGPARIGKGISQQPLLPGMVLSNEPGVYFENKYGIRIENLMYVDYHDSHSFKLTNLTLVPYNSKLIDFTMLNDSSKAWLRRYYTQIREVILPKLKGEKAYEWLEKEINITF